MCKYKSSHENTNFSLISCSSYFTGLVSRQRSTVRDVLSSWLVVVVATVAGNITLACWCQHHIYPTSVSDLEPRQVCLQPSSSSSSAPSTSPITFPFSPTPFPLPSLPITPPLLLPLHPRPGRVHTPRFMKLTITFCLTFIRGAGRNSTAWLLLLTPITGASEPRLPPPPPAAQKRSFCCCRSCRLQGDRLGRGTEPSLGPTIYLRYT